MIVPISFSPSAAVVAIFTWAATDKSVAFRFRSITAVSGTAPVGPVRFAVMVWCWVRSIT